MPAAGKNVFSRKLTKQVILMVPVGSGYRYSLVPVGSEFIAAVPLAVCCWLLCSL